MRKSNEKQKLINHNFSIKNILTDLLITSVFFRTGGKGGYSGYILLLQPLLAFFNTSCFFSSFFHKRTLCRCTLNAVSRGNCQPARTGFPPCACSQGFTPPCNQRVLLCWSSPAFQCSHFVSSSEYSAPPLDTRVSPLPAVPCAQRSRHSQARSHRCLCLWQNPPPEHSKPRSCRLLFTGAARWYPLAARTSLFVVRQMTKQLLSRYQSPCMNTSVFFPLCPHASDNFPHCRFPEQWNKETPSSFVSTSVPGTDDELLRPHWSLAGPSEAEQPGWVPGPSPPSPAPAALCRALPAAARAPTSVLLQTEPSPFLSPDWDVSRELDWEETPNPSPCVILWSWLSVQTGSVARVTTLPLSRS